MSNTISPPSLEEQLDKVSNNELDWQQLLRDFWDDFIGAVGEIKDLRITQVLDALNDLLGPHVFPKRADGGDAAPMPELRRRPIVAEGRALRRLCRLLALSGMQLYAPARRRVRMARTPRTKVLGKDPVTGLDVTLRGGRFGPYVQLGEGDKETKEKPKRAGLPKGTVARRCRSARRRSACCRCRAMSARHPENGEMIIAGIGRFGSYVKHGKTYANLEPATTSSISVSTARSR